MEVNPDNKKDAKGHSASAIGGDLTSPFLETLPDYADFGSVSDPNFLNPTDFDLSFDELWPTNINQDPGDANTSQNLAQKLHTVESSSPILTPSTLPPKVGHRFTLEALRSLKEWFSTHADNPYPTEEERTILENQTGLSRTQITNWLANARRRRTIADGRANGNTQAPEGHTPTRSGTPMPRNGKSLRDLDPLQRWENSPPENEPAAVSDIARAMGNLSRSRGRRGTFDEKIPRRRRHRSTTSSLGTSRSGSTDSRSSRGSISGISSHSRGRSILRPQKLNSLTKARHQYQCTFCTETFKRKYDWQRHENSLHLPLERWECSPNGPTVVDPDNGQTFCLFCSQENPDENHLAHHNPSACQERAFSRKDHLKQHLRLVHNAALTDLTTKLWKTTQPDITSRCGFCQASLSTWPDRVDHLANHFKLGCTMKSWNGDWGFEPFVLKTLENAMPPYLVYFEGQTPYPHTANGSSPDSPRTAYELISIELAYFIQHYNDTTGSLPSHRALQLEACRIVFGSEVAFPETNLDSDGGSSWLRDLILSSDEIVQQARFAPIRSRAESRLSVLRIKGKNALFEDCPLESRLHAFVGDQRAKGIYTSSEDELRREAGRIVLQMESELQTKPEFVANWLVGFLNNSTSWIGQFRQRTMSGSQNVLEPSHAWQWQLDNPSNEAQNSWPNGSEWLFVGHGDAAETDMGWGIETGDSANLMSTDTSLQDFTWLWSDDQSPPAIPQSNLNSGAEGQSTLRPTWLGPGIYVLNDPNHIPWFAREMKRWVKAAMSPNNPICHVPSDEELRHQARCLLYNDDDPWNQTPADNAQWLEIFKREAGIL